MIRTPCNRVSRSVVEDRDEPVRKCRPDPLLCFFMSDCGVKHATCGRQIDVIRDNRKMCKLVGEDEIAFNKFQDLVEERIRHAKPDEKHRTCREKRPYDFSRNSSECRIRA